MSWEWSKYHDKDLARCVIKEAVQLLPPLSQSAFDAQAQRKPDDRYELVRAIYQQLQAKEIHSAYEQYQPAAELQLIRTPAEVLVTPKEGTCLDLALLFCGICLYYELLPLLIVLEGHALAAVSLNHSLREWNSLGKERNLFNTATLFTDEPTLQQLVADQAYVAVECTGFARTRSFAGSARPEAIGRDVDGQMTFKRATQAGAEQLAQTDRPLQYAIDIAVAHNKWKIKSEQIKPLKPEPREDSDLPTTPPTRPQKRQGRLRLNGRQREQLADALYAAFPTAPELERMLVAQLDLSLNTIPGAGDYLHQLFLLVQRMDAEAKVEDLIRGARQAKPSNPELQILEDKWLTNT